MDNVSEVLEDNSADSVDPTERKREGGRIGGLARSDAKVAASRANAAKARVMREYYRRNPYLRNQHLDDEAV
jgi:hypothetical protein